ncbi:hypothetical protein, partial [Stenotrophomonas sp. A3_2]|uniref:hypothetical protein n=1 Tax=Stenotrophomonas sp. A3_2 TaxID=3119978 RepID=UPI002FC2C649
IGGATSLSIGLQAELQNPATPGALLPALRGGTIADAAGAITYGAGVSFTDIAYRGIINLTAAGASITETGSFSLTGANGTGTGTLTISGAGARFASDGGQLDNIRINLGSASTSAGGTQVGAAQLGGPTAAPIIGTPVPGTITLGASATL